MGKVASVKRDTLTVREVADAIHLSRNVVTTMIRLGFFTELRPSLVTSRGHFQIYADEVRELQRLHNLGLNRDRILSGMEDYRGRMGRK